MEFSMDSRGKIREIPVYTGAYYRFEASPDALRKSTIRLVCLLLAAVLATFVPLFVGCAYAKVFYAFLPQAFAMIPLYMFVAALWRIRTAKGDVIHEHRDRIVNRLQNASIFFMIVSVMSVGSAIAFVILETPSVTDWAMIAVNALRVPVALAFLKLRKSFAMQVVGDSSKSSKKKQ